MTIVRTITSHSENAAAVEAGLFSNTLASDASSSAFLLEMLQGGLRVDSAPGLVDAAWSFISHASAVAERKGTIGKQTFRNLIPFRAAVQVIGDTDKLSAVAESLERVLNDFEKSNESDENIGELIAQLDEFAIIFSTQSSNVANITKAPH